MRDPDDGLGETFPVDGRGRRWWNRSSPSWAATTRCTGSSSRRWRTTRSHASIRSRTGTAGWPTVATRHAVAGPSTLRVRAGGVGGPGAAGRVLRRLADLRPCGDVHRVHRVLPAAILEALHRISPDRSPYPPERSGTGWRLRANTAARASSRARRTVRCRRPSPAPRRAAICAMQWPSRRCDGAATRRPAVPSTDSRAAEGMTLLSRQPSAREPAPQSADAASHRRGGDADVRDVGVAFKSDKYTITILLDTAPLTGKLVLSKPRSDRRRKPSCRRSRLAPLPRAEPLSAPLLPSGLRASRG